MNKSRKRSVCVCVRERERKRERERAQLVRENRKESFKGREGERRYERKRDGEFLCEIACC